MTHFKDIWNITFHGADSFEKSEKLTKAELLAIQNLIAKMQSRGVMSSRIITALQKSNRKLAERWKAERAYWTEVKRSDTSLVGDAGDHLDIDKYRVILSPHACEVCRGKTRNGSRVFKSTDLEKAGYGHVPPFHPNCYCILIPIA